MLYNERSTYTHEFDHIRSHHTYLYNIEQWVTTSINKVLRIKGTKILLYAKLN